MKAQTRKTRLRARSARFPRFIEWSEEDGVFIGSAPRTSGNVATEPPRRTLPVSLP